MYLKFMFGFGFAFLMFGCRSYEPAILYEGPIRLDTELAIIATCSWCPGREMSVDGGEVFLTNIARVLPGDHVLNVQLHPLFGKGNLKRAEFKINVEAGHKYSVSKMVLDRNGKECSFFGHLLPGDKKTFIWLEDQMTGKVVGGHRPWIDAKTYTVKDSKRLQYWPQNQTENRTRPDGLEEFPFCKSSNLNVSGGGSLAVAGLHDFYYGEGIILAKQILDIENLYFYANWNEGFEGH